MNLKLILFAVFVNRKNASITLDEFKWIWHMEYGHRMWGRLIGAAFYIPAGIFWARGWLSPLMKKRVVFLGSLLACQVCSQYGIIYCIIIADC